jgi:uncharacterized PurR-regulated membrane protein YhhQ (DUF165 family)
VKATLSGVNEMLGVGRLPHQPSNAFDDILTPVYDRAVVIIIPSHILKSVKFSLPKSLIIWHASQELLKDIPVFEDSEMPSGVFFVLQIVIVSLHAFLLDPTLDIFVFFTHRKQVLGIYL